MTQALLRESDTIAAVSTAWGEGGIGIVRISGPEALSVLAKIFRPGPAPGQAPINRTEDKDEMTKADAELGVDAGGEMRKADGKADTKTDIAMSNTDGKSEHPVFENRKLIYGHIVVPGDTASSNIATPGGQVVDEVLAVYMKAPHTYTCEDVVEIQCHGGVAALKEILSLVLKNGAREAGPGEFTRRAFLNGRLDLAQAEAVMDMIEAETETSLTSAAGQLTGKLSEKIKDLRGQLLTILVDMAVNIDYPDEDIEEIVYESLAEKLERIRFHVKELLDTADTGRLLKEGIKVAIVGKPNVGKSTLLNALLGMDRAIVTDVAGTTRDVIAEHLNIGGLPVRLIDTAGIRHASDEVERLGVDRSRKAIGEADLVLLVLDTGRPLEEEDRQIAEAVAGKPAIVFFNKADLASAISREEADGILPGAPRISISLKEGNDDAQADKKTTREDLLTALGDELQKTFVEKGGTKKKESLFITSARHEGLLSSAADSLLDALGRIIGREPLELTEIDVRDAYASLGEILGEEVAGDIIDTVFERFCLGK